MSDPQPYTDDEFADLKDEWDFHGGWQPHRDLVARLFATVEARDTQVADAHAAIRRLIATGHDWWFNTDDATWLDVGPLGDTNAREPMTPGEVAAIKQARATEGDRSDG